jgi:hypothetical protein
MKGFLGVALSALVLMAPVVSEAASQTQSAAYSNQHPYAWLDYQNGVHLMPSSPVARRAASAPELRDSTAALMNQTGDGGSR